MSSWVETPRIYTLESLDVRGQYVRKLYVTEDNCKFQGVLQNVMVTPLEHQTYTVQAMMELELRQYVNIASTSMIVETRAGVLSERPGSGKTLEVLMLIDLVPQPPKRAEITSLPIAKDVKMGRALKRRTGFTYLGDSLCVRKRYSKIFPQTLIFVGKSVLAQWIRHINEHTKFEAFIINDIFDLRNFCKICMSRNAVKKLSKYQIVLVKNGKINGALGLPEFKNSPLERKKNKPIINVFGDLLKHICWSRLVLDDFDYLNIPREALVIPSLFTWFVSATKRSTSTDSLIGKDNSIDDIIRDLRPRYISTWHNRELFTFFNVGCTPEFIDRSTQSSMIKFYVYTFDNPNDNMIGLITALNSGEADDIIEMLNNDAVGSAAKAANITGNSVADVFEKILETKWSKYKKAVDVLAYLEKINNHYNSLPVTADRGKLLGDAQIAKLKSNVKNTTSLKAFRALVKYKQPAVAETLGELTDVYTKMKDENGKAIQRVKDNLKFGECPISSENLSDLQNLVILKCCGIVISAEVVSWALKIHKDKSDVAGTCPNCRKNINIRDLIFIDKDKVNLSDVIDDSEAMEQKDDRYLVKYECILDIIRGSPRPRESVLVKIPGLLAGKVDKGDPADEDRKTLIFANYSETMQIMEDVLVNNAIPYFKIQGTAIQIKEIVDRYYLPNSDEESVSVLLISGPKYVAGLDLQNTTDLIFTGKISDANIESQIAGRICRIGRTCNANIHYVLYKNEYQQWFSQK
jgi:hypothetical protein